MGAGLFSVEASVMKNGKLEKGRLSLFNDEYVFGNDRKTVNWEKVSCEQGTTSVKAFLRSVDKPHIVFRYDGSTSPAFVMEQQDVSAVLRQVKEYADSIRYEREAKEEKARKEAEASRKQAEEEQRIREESKRKVEEEFKAQEEEKRRKKEEEIRQANAFKEQRVNEKKERIARVVESVKAKPEEIVELEPISKKAASLFLDNPYRILGISCVSDIEDANTALDKLKKLARLKALEAFKSPFDLEGVEKPIRDLSVAQNALTLLKDKNNRFFWFSEPEPCIAWQEGKYRMELAKDGEEYGTYDLFLANYLYAILRDPDFNVAETWKRILNFYCYICKESSGELLKSRFSKKEMQEFTQAEILNDFRKVIFKPIIALCERDDLDAIIRLHKYIKDCDNRLLEGLTRDILGKMVAWFTDKESEVLRFLAPTDDEEVISAERGKEIRERGEKYCQVVESVFEVVLRDFRGDAVRYDMIKESYRNTTYQLMYELHKCADMTDAIFFANKCYGYCKADDKKRIQNTFGEVNIKAIDWNIPHTQWDVKGDDYFFGRSCEVDYTQALYWYHKAADEGNMYSQNSIGLCYQKGLGVPQDDEQATSWFKKAAKSGNPQAAYHLAECYMDGIGVRKDIDEALRYFSEAAKLGHPSAQKRRDEINAEVSGRRKNHRAKNHICHDLGFQMTTGPLMVVEVTLNQPANVYLVNAQGYQKYLTGGDFTHEGGHATDSTYRIAIPSSNHWYIIVDNGDDPITGITSSAKVKSM